MNESHLTRISSFDCWQDEISISPLSGGMTNFNYRVDTNAQSYVVRLGDDDPVHLISRKNEIASSRAAYEIGLSPEIIHHQPGALVIRFIEGRVFEESDVRKKENLTRIVDNLRLLHHKAPPHFHDIPVMFWVFQILRHYHYLLLDSQSRYKDQLAELEKIATKLEQSAGLVNIVFGHNDLLAANFIDDGEKLWLIDFDYAGFNSPMFDLANLASNNDLNAELEIDMLEQYFDGPLNRVQWRKYYAMKCASLLRETLWAMVSEVHSKIDFDYSEYTRKNLERFQSAYSEFDADYL